MTDDIDDSQDDEGRWEERWEEIEASLDRMSIAEQVAWIVDAVYEADFKLVVAKRLAQKIVAAADVGVLNEEEGARLAPAVTKGVKDLQAMLVIYWSGFNSEREKLEQLHHIYYPSRRPDEGTALSLNDHMFLLRGGVPMKALMDETLGQLENRYWEMLRAYVESHPDEPPGWRERLEKRGLSQAATPGADSC